MKQLIMFFYRSLLYPLFVLIFLIIAVFHNKTRQGLRLRLNALKSRRPVLGECIWIHAASGEYEFAKPFVRLLKIEQPNIKVLVTFFSPSYEKQIQSDPNVDFVEALPLDLPSPIRSFLGHYKPKCLIIARTDLWPELLNQCQQKKVPVALISAKSPHNSQPNWLHRFWKGFLFSFISRIYTVSDKDTSYFKTINPLVQIIKTGDTRYDQVIFRLQNTKVDSLPQRAASPLVLCAGSTWPEDEVVLIPALSKLVKSQRLRIAIAPHEPTDSHIRSLQKICDQYQLSTQKLSEQKSWDSQVLIIDKLGVLAAFYSICDLAFIGGSFKSKVHSVMEALAAGLPSLVGPHFQNNPEAIEFSQISFSGDELPNSVHSAKCMEDIELWAEQLLTQQEDIEAWHKTIKKHVLSRSGATRQVLHHMTDWINA